MDVECISCKQKLTHNADLESNDLRCNVGGEDGSTTNTVSVTAGSSVTFTADTAVYHQGPVSFYMTKVDDAAAADGSTPWFKIKDIGPTVSHSTFHERYKRLF